jgi:predicted DNA-binding transcriptional regulator YafY
MGASKSNETALRLMVLFEIIKGANKERPLTRAEIRHKLDELAIAVSEEQIGKDIKGLIAQKDHYLFLQGIKQNKKKRPHTYWYEKGVIVDVNPQLAFILKLAEQYLGEFLPAKEKEELQILFQKAEQILERGGNVKYKRLLSRFEIFPRGYQLIPPEIEAKQFQDILTALSQNKKLRFSYTPKGGGLTKNVDSVEPLGIVDRSGIITLVVRSPESDDKRNYNLSRMRNLEVVSDFAYPRDFSIKQWVGDGKMNKRLFENGSTEIPVKLKLDKHECADLLESKLSHDQRLINVSDNYFIIAATVKNSIEFLWWLRERGSGCEVIEPIELKTMLSGG